MIAEFIKYAMARANKAIYVWGGQGQNATEEKIKRMETSIKNAATALNLLNQRKREGVSPVEMYDCSGLVCCALVSSGIKPAGFDTTANGLLKNHCVKIDKSVLRKGDLVFRVYSFGKNKGTAYHVGIVTDDALNVTEAKGRAYGVITRPLGAQAGYWNAYARIKELADEPEEKYIFTRNLKKGLKGQDVYNLQKLLNISADGVFGSKTRSAVIAAQKAHGLTPDGIAGKNTLTALGGIWKTEHVFNRNLKYGMTGQDIKELQKLLNVSADGVFGSKTRAAVISAQKKHGLTLDGIAGKKTITALGGKFN